jgi:hypothetical protein
MSKFVKILGLIFLPVAAIVFVFAFLSNNAGKSNRSFFIREYDEQNIYG